MDKMIEFNFLLSQAKDLKKWCNEHYDESKGDCPGCPGAKNHKLCFYIEMFNREDFEPDPCPFCGSDDVTKVVEMDSDKAFVKCNTCGATGPKNQQGVDEAVIDWNYCLRKEKSVRE